MVLMIAEYLEEQFTGAGGDWGGLLGELDAADPYGLDAVAVRISQLCQSISQLFQWIMSGFSVDVRPISQLFQWILSGLSKF